MRKSIIHPRLLLFHMNYYTYIHMYNQSISHFIIIFSVYLFRNIWFYSKNKGNSLACHRYGRPRHGYGAGDGNGAGRRRHEFSLHLRRRYHDRSRREPFLLLLVKFHKKSVSHFYPRYAFAFSCSEKYLCPAFLNKNRISNGRSLHRG